ncbi:hypothetical protein C1909_11200 [Listeria ivanovii]|uniref:DUF4352 domain-containing protein n=1 Tax=Listeria ivanovii (strain ATCC BAA-678 / PAM 55) TaxID=881621 RepID=G2Z8J2_LISIP|nr:hypothetical protein [Listeria ivanovii]MBK3914950.1 hypothetical protein [Listeria ivanovii subsp. ivanovii]MBK3921889.1 hypothetical protein [Listeria ivanovii subsp. ivanovii]MBK3927238.1 hypothetical protein [Listeria ivanovii subsp. ivanovii]MCJ1717789.1 hypothetical protein [Listeria ivanovii]MCJ1722988.1 hypothetical protein [Listeria ivanovii]
MKKIIGGVLIVVLIGLFVWRVYDLNANAFSYKDKIHSKQEVFELASAEISVENAVVIEGAEINKYVDEDYYKNDSEDFLLVQLWSTEKNIGISDFQLGYQNFVTLSDISAISHEFDEAKGRYKFNLGFNVPKELIKNKQQFILAVPSKYWSNGVRDIIEINL